LNTTQSKIPNQNKIIIWNFRN